MGSFVGSLQFRVNQESPAAYAAIAHNAVHAAIIGSGMTQVSSADFAGQAGTFVAGTAGPGETGIGELSGGGFEYREDGYKLYKHPVLNLYVRVGFVSVRYGWPSRFTNYNFRFGLELAGGTLTPGKLSPIIYPFGQVYGGETSTAAITTATVPLQVNCGDDNFWIHAPGAMGLAQIVNNYTPVGVGSQLSVGIFEDAGSYGVVSTPLFVGQQTSNYGPSLTTSTGPQGSRYWVSDGTSWAEAQQCSFGQLNDPASTTVDGSTRVARASKVISGERRYFKFGFISGLGAVEGDILSLDLDGAGAKNYKVCVALGPSSPMSYNYTASQYSVPILPWGH